MSSALQSLISQETARDRDGDLSSIGSFSTWLLYLSLGPVKSWKPGTPSESPEQVSGAQMLEPLPLFSHAHE